MKLVMMREAAGECIKWNDMYAVFVENGKIVDHIFGDIEDEVVKAMLGMKEKVVPLNGFLGWGGDDFTYVVSTEDMRYGSGILLRKSVFAKLANELDSDLYILPSSIHEVLCLPKNEMDDVDYLREMVTNINRDYVAPNERLTDNVYRYWRTIDVITEA